EVELAVREGEAASVRGHAAHAREGGGEALERRVRDRRHALGPRVERLEEVVRRAVAVLLAEAGVGGADVDDRRLGARPQLVYEEAELALAAPERDVRGELPHDHRSQAYSRAVLQDVVRPAGQYSLALSARLSSDATRTFRDGVFATAAG